jgi:hypothetical protein
VYPSILSVTVFDPGNWAEVAEKSAKEKVSHALCNARLALDRESSFTTHSQREQPAQPTLELLADTNKLLQLRKSSLRQSG